MAKGAGSPLLNEHLFHHLNQFVVVQDLLDDMRMGLAIIFAVREAALSAHLSTPSFPIIRLLYPFDKKMK